MANRWKGNFVVATAATSSGTDYAGKANGAWGLNSQLQQKQGGLWAKGLLPPNAPIILSASGGDSQGTVYFSAPTDTGGSAITSYTVTSTPAGITASGISSPIVINGLTNGTSYTFKVKASNSCGFGPESLSSSVVTPLAAPTVIGQTFGGGFYAGKISTTKDGIATHYLIVAPKASGQTTGKKFGPDTYPLLFPDPPYTYDIIRADGPANSSRMATVGGAGFEAATFCENLVIGGYSDWYMPSQDELFVLYYFLKPTTTVNGLYGSNTISVSPYLRNVYFTPTIPAQTPAGNGFRTGEVEAFTAGWYFSSTASGQYAAETIVFSSGERTQFDTANISINTRAVRRIPI